MERGKAQSRAPLTTKKWQEFRVEFELRRGRVDDWTEREEHDLLYNQLKDYWRIQVAKEEKALQKRQFWVRMTNLEEGVDEGEFRAELQELVGAKIGAVQRIPQGYMVECGSEEARGKLLSLNGVDLNHRVVRVSYGEKSMTGTQIFEFIGAALQLTEDVSGIPQPRREKDHRVPTWKAQVRQVENDPVAYEEAWEE